MDANTNYGILSSLGLLLCLLQRPCHGHPCAGSAPRCFRAVSNQSRGGQGKLHILLCPWIHKVSSSWTRGRWWWAETAPGTQFLMMTITLLRAFVSILYGAHCFSKGSWHWHRRSLLPVIFHGLSRDVQPSL